MEKALKDAITICKTLLRNGYDAHVINAPVQEHLLKHSKQLAVDIACEPDLETLLKLFPEARVEPDQRAIAQMEKDGVLFRFYALEVEDASHPELSLLRQHDGSPGAPAAAHDRLRQPGPHRRCL